MYVCMYVCMYVFQTQVIPSARHLRAVRGSKSCDRASGRVQAVRPGMQLGETVAPWFPNGGFHGFHKYGYPQMGGFFRGKSHLEMDDPTIPLFRKPSNRSLLISTVSMLAFAWLATSIRCLNLGAWPEMTRYMMSP